MADGITMQQIPRDVQLMIVSLLTPLETIRLIRPLSKYWYNLTRSDLLWKQYLRENPIFKKYNLEFLLSKCDRSLEWQCRAVMFNISRVKAKVGHVIMGHAEYICLGDYREDGSATGTGIFLWPKHQVGYVGQLKEGTRTGQGSEYISGVLRYQGEWRCGFYHGVGTSFDADGNMRHSGMWRDSRWVPN